MSTNKFPIFEKNKKTSVPTNFPRTKTPSESIEGQVSIFFQKNMFPPKMSQNMPRHGPLHFIIFLFSIFWTCFGQLVGHFLIMGGLQAALKRDSLFFVCFAWANRRYHMFSVHASTHRAQ